MITKRSPGWVMFDNDQGLGKLKALRATLDTFMTHDMNNVMIHETKELVKQFSESHVEVLFDQFLAIEPAVDELKAFHDMLRRMRKAHVEE